MSIRHKIQPTTLLEVFVHQISRQQPGCQDPSFYGNQKFTHHQTLHQLLVGDPEVKAVESFTTHTSEQNDVLSRLCQLSSWSTLIKVVARIKRLRCKAGQHGDLVTVEERRKATEMHPVILPKDCPITKLVLSHYHAMICHQGRSQTLMELRANGFWTIGGSKAVAKLIQLRRQTE